MQRRSAAANNEHELVEFSDDRHALTPPAPGQRRTLHATSTGRPGETDQLLSTLRVLKWIAVIFIALIFLAGAVLSKVSLVSITGRMYRLSCEGHTLHDRSVLFIQLTLLLIIPEVFSFFRCFMLGVFGKTKRNLPWPSRMALVQVYITIHYNSLRSHVYKYYKLYRLQMLVELVGLLFVRSV